MIVFDLMCSAGHRFEGWFASADDFASQRARGLLSCPRCDSLGIERVPSATRINLGSAEPQEKQSVPAEGVATRPAPGAEHRDPMALAQILYSRMLDELLTKSEDVGREFPAEARRIYYEEAPARAIRGVASAEEHDALVDEGIPVARIPVPPPESRN